MISVKAPGKLYIAGEYAVVESGTPAIIAAVDQYITATIQEANGSYGKIQSNQYSQSIQWNLVNDSIHLLNNDKSFDYVISSLMVMDNYISEMNISKKIFNININSTLNSNDGKKYGLGSSAAVTVVIVKAINKFYKLNLSPLQIFKLSAIAHLNVQGNGSLGDVAASSFGGWISYSSFDKEWLKNSELSVSEIINTSWPDLFISPLTPPNDLKLLIGWTGTPASTHNLLDQVKKDSNVGTYTSFIESSKQCILKMIDGFKNQDIEVIKQQIRENRKIIKSLSNSTGVDIETDQLSSLCEIVESYNGAGKSSGAGGGDCGIAIVENNSSIDLIEDEWKRNDIIPLHLNIAEKE